MLYNSLAFAAFVTVAAGGYRLCPSRWRVWYLLLASYVFYFSWSVVFALLLLGLSGFAFVVGRQLAGETDEGRRRRWLAGGVLVLFVPLGTLKYASAILESIAGAAEAEGAWGGASDAIVAVGISYYTFKLVSYVVDIYWQRIAPTAQFANLAVYAAFFPQILSGPIQRAGDFGEQLARVGYLTRGLAASGFRLLLFGFFKKLVVADRLGIAVDQIFSDPLAYSEPVLALGCYMFAIQLYADFSGITDIAIGLGRLFGISAPPNFDSPFYAQNIQEFWRRWHMTLTSWLADYLFMPLRMALRTWGQLGLAVSLAINMLAIALWHGARGTFVAFGVIQAVFIIASSLTLHRRKKFLRRHPGLGWAHAILGPLVTFHMMVSSLVFFRAESLGDAWYILAHACNAFWGALSGAGFVATAALGGHRGLPLNQGDLMIVLWCLVVMELVHLLRHREVFLRVAVRAPVWVRWGGYFALGFAILLWGESGGKQFIYVRF